MSSCYRTANNKFFKAPPRMADGRHFTDYRQNYALNNNVSTDNGVETSYEFRMFLTRNANKIIELNKKHSFLKNGVTDCKQPYEIGTMLPEKTKVRCDLAKCEVVDNYDNGIGQGRIYNTKPNACLAPFTSAPYELDNNQCLPVDDLAGYYTLNKADTVQRPAVVGGGDIGQGGDPNSVN